MDKQLAGGFGNIQIVLEEFIDGEQGLLVQCINGVLLKDLLQEHLAQGGGQLIDQAADTQIFVVDDIALRVKDLAHFNGDLRLLVGFGQIAQVHGHRTHAYEYTALTVQTQRLFDLGSDLLQFLGAGAFAHLVDQRHIGLTHA